MEAINKKPITASIVIMCVAITITFIPLEGILKGICEEQLAAYICGTFEQIGVSCMLVAFMKHVGLLDEVGFQKTVKAIWVIWPMMLFIILNVIDYIGGIHQIDFDRPLVILFFVVCYLSTGLFEEILCRGIVFNLLRQKWGNTKRGCLYALLFSSVLFGLSHFIHFVLGHTDLIATVTQVIYATFLGVYFGGCYLRNKSIFPVIMLHGLVDIVCDLGEICVGEGIDKSLKTMAIGQSIILLLIILPFFLYGLWCVRCEFAKTRKVDNNK